MQCSLRLQSGFYGALVMGLVGCKAPLDKAGPPAETDASESDAHEERSPPDTPSPSGADAEVQLAAAGDFGGRDDFAGTVMTDMLDRDLAGFFLLGDTSYSEIVPEQAWCDWVHGYLGPRYPLQVIAGNHEEDRKVDGYILAFARCMPDRLESALGPGGYGVNFASDLGPVTFIATSPDLSVGGVYYGYAPGSAEREWLVAAIDAAKRQGDWVVVGMHKDCITIGNKTCEIGQEFAQLLIDEGVDLVLQGHDHDYQRTHALATVVEGDVGRIADSGDDGVYARGAGTVFVIVGTAGRGVTTCSHADSEYGNFATHWCGEEAGDTKGYLVISADRSTLTAEYVSTTGTAFSDRFTLR